MADLKSIVPRVVPGCDIRKLPIGPAEGFVLSRIDGHTSAADIASMTGLGPAVLEILVKLADLGAITNVSTGAPRTTPSAQTAPPKAAAPEPQPGARSVAPEARAPSPPPPKPDEQGSPAGRIPPRDASSPKASVAPAAVQKGPQRYTEAELEEPAEIELETKRRILELFYALPDSNHYEVLGVPRDAEKKAIKSAYYKLAAEFHPDKYFRKQVGTFKQKLEAIFKRVTEAEQTLTRKEPRAEYDASLGEAPAERAPAQRIIFDSVPTAGPRPVPAHLQHMTPPPPRAASDAPSPPPPESPRVPETARSATLEGNGSGRPSPPPQKPPSEPRVEVVKPPSDPRIQSMPPEPPPIERPSVIPAVLSDAQRAQMEERRRQLANRLSSGKFAAARPAPPTTSQEDAALALKRLAAEKAAASLSEQALRHLQAADAAAARDDAVAAANAYRLAAASMPSPEIEEKVRIWTQKAAGVLSKRYRDEGERFMKDGRYEEGAKSLSRAAAGAPQDAKLQEAAAKAIVLAGGDLKAAAEFARKAVEARPTDLSFRVTLAEIYLSANMRANAKREAEAAAKIDPKDAKVRALLDRVR